MRHAVWIPLLSAGVLGLPATGPGRELDTRCLWEVCLQPTQDGNTVAFDTINRSAAPITVNIRFATLANLTPYPTLPPAHVVPPQGYARVAQFVVENPYARWSFRYNWSWVIGDARARHHGSFLYRMPFGGDQEREVSQGNNGWFSHRGAHRYAFDFAMPVDTPILAARAGLVIRVTDGHNKVGITDAFLSKANAVLILHEDRTIATYAHLDPGSGVREGMRVLSGEVVGFSGNTGYSTGPHLHFEVWKTDWNGAVNTLPIRFHDRKRGRVLPVNGELYAPGCNDRWVACRPGDLPNELRVRDPGYMTRSEDGTCRCNNGSVITTHLPCRMVCPKR